MKTLVPATKELTKLNAVRPPVDECKVGCSSKCVVCMPYAGCKDIWEQ